MVHNECPKQKVKAEICPLYQKKKKVRNVNID